MRDPGGNVGGVSPTSSFFENPSGDRIVEIGTVGLFFVDPSTGDTIFLYSPGSNTLAIGLGNQVSGSNSMAVGFDNVVSGFNSSAFGNENIVGDYASTAVGSQNTVTVGLSAAFGSGNFVDSGQSAFAVGSLNTSRALYSFVCGRQNHANGVASGVFGGLLNSARGSNAVIAGGTANAATGADAFIGGGAEQYCIGY